MRIASKKEMYDLQHRGLLGNYLPIWSWRDFFEYGPEGNYGFRHRTQTGSPLFRRGMNRAQVIDYVSRLLFIGRISEQDVVISQDTSLYDDCRTLQGETMRSDRGVLFAHSGKIGTDLTCREEMRQDSLVEVVGLHVKCLFQQYLDEQSYDWMQELLSMYPDAVVEFTSFSCGVGIFGWNTIFWEVRNY